MKQYNVTGMSCAACSARVEKAVSKVPGVTACSVSLLTNSMGVEGTAAPQAVIAAVEAVQLFTLLGSCDVDDLLLNLLGVLLGWGLLRLFSRGRDAVN